MRTIVFSSQYKKDLKLARKRNLPENDLNEVVFSLANDIPLAAKYHDHELTGNFRGFRECHIRPGLVASVHQRGQRRTAHP